LGGVPRLVTAAIIARSTRVATCRTLVFATLALLLAIQALDSWVHAAPTTIWLVSLAALLIFVPGMLRDNLRSYIWLCFVSLLYFMALVLRLFALPTDPVSWVGMFAVVVLFNSSMMYVRWRAPELRGEQDLSGEEDL
jgi:uncharacterized membrane protein